ncbi:MAG: DNA-binding protein [Acidimicrobiia bacterium]
MSGGRKVEVDQLVGAAEIAERLDLSHPQNVHVWRKRHADFPQPVAKLQQALVWYWPDVEAWARKTGRYPLE